MTPESEDVMRDNLLPHIETSRHMANQRIARIPTDVLAIRPRGRRTAAPAEFAYIMRAPRRDPDGPEHEP